MFQNMCDDCRKLGDVIVHINGKDLCKLCVNRRLDYTTTILPIGAMCIRCKGSGKVVDDECFVCGGSGQAQFCR